MVGMVTVVSLFLLELFKGAQACNKKCTKLVTSKYVEKVCSGAEKKYACMDIR